MAETYVLSTGKRIVLSAHSPEQWAADRREKLLALGCSPTYADDYANLIRDAVKA